jgi:hypothetical protein
MNSKVWIKKAVSICLVVATMATYSMVTLANSEKIAGALSISGKNINGDAPVVKVNGEAAQTGRSIFSSSTIATPADTNAVIDLGKVGKIELAPNTTLALSFNEKGISGDLSSGRVTVLNSSDTVSIKTLNGNVAKLNAGETAVATNGKAQDDDDDDTTKGGGSGWLLFAGILGGAAVAIIIAANSDNNRVALGGSTTVISPSR